MAPTVTGECTSVPGIMVSSHLLAMLSNLMTLCLLTLVSKSWGEGEREKVKDGRERERVMLSNLMTSCLSILVSKRQTHRYRDRDIERERQRERDRETKIEELE